jgi:hypothetical protein
VSEGTKLLSSSEVRKVDRVNEFAVQVHEVQNPTSILLKQHDSLNLVLLQSGMELSVLEASVLHEYSFVRGKSER